MTPINKTQTQLTAALQLRCWRRNQSSKQFQKLLGRV